MDREELIDFIKFKLEDEGIDGVLEHVSIEELERLVPDIGLTVKDYQEAMWELTGLLEGIES